jgi:uncharacterized membrane protein YfcA
MNAADATLLGALVFVGALLSASVGHGGASSYLAAMAFFGLAAPAMRSSALVLNLLVAGLAVVRFAAVGGLPWRTLAPLVAASIPLAWLGGALTLPGRVHAWLLGSALLVAAVQLVARLPVSDDAPLRTLPVRGALVLGAALGLLAGLTGVGGGIFLSPVLVLGRFARPRDAGGLSAAFIWLNSAAALLARADAFASLPPALPGWAAAAIVGGGLGASFGSARAAPRTLRRLLAAVLCVAALKLLLS